jgi:type II secretory pathway pseudopilin PulG
LDLPAGPLAIAIIGVLGTLLAPTLSSLVTDRSRRKEFERTRSERLEEAQREETRATRLELRQCYVAFNTAARDYHRALRTWSYAEDNDTDEASAASGIPQTRQAFQTAYAEAQMIVTAPVLVLTQKVASQLADAYSILKNMEEGSHDPATDTTELARRILNGAWPLLTDLRVAMRADLNLPTS